MPSTAGALDRAGLGAPAAPECVVVDSRQVVHRGGLHRFHMVFGEVVGIHIDDRFVRDGRVDTAAMQLIGRLGYDEYSVLDRTFRMARPAPDAPSLPGA